MSTLAQMTRTSRPNLRQIAASHTSYVLLLCVLALHGASSQPSVTPPDAGPNASPGLSPDTQFYPSKCKALCTQQSQFMATIKGTPSLDDGNRATQWMNLAVLQIAYATKVKPMSPPMAARFLAIAGSCLHDTLIAVTDAPWASACGNKDVYAKSLGNNGEAAVSGAMYEALTHFFPWDAATNLTNSFLAATGDRDAHPQSFANGRKACAAMIASRATDGSNSGGSTNCPKNEPYCDCTNYAPKNPPQAAPATCNCAAITHINSWQPLCVPPRNGDPTTCKVQSYGGATAAVTRPYAANPTMIVPPGPPLMGTADESKLLANIKAVVDAAATLGDYEKLVAEFWADGPDMAMPPGHWTHIACEAARAEKLTLRRSVQLLFLVTNALMDAGISAWNAKRIYDSARPILLAQCALGPDTDIVSWKGLYKGAGSMKANSWQPYQAPWVVTPAFSGYVSGHSTFSSAAQEVLKRFFGGNQFKGPRCRLVPQGGGLLEPKIEAGGAGYVQGLTDMPNTGSGTPGYVPAKDSVLCWETFQEAAEQAGLSRIYGGIHLPCDNVDGAAMGTQVGKAVWWKAVSQWRGKHPMGLSVL